MSGVKDDNIFRPQKIGDGKFTNVYTTKTKDKVVRIYKTFGHAKHRFAMYYNEWQVYNTVNSQYVQTCLHYAKEKMLFVERRACADLFNFLMFKKGNLSDAMLRHFKTHIMLGMNALHEAGIFCQDLKMENVLLFPEKRSDGSWGLSCKLSDFNIVQGKGLIDLHRVYHDGCRRLTEATTTTDITVLTGARKSMMGTYHAPEEYDESPFEVGFAADIFRFGIIMYHLYFLHRHVLADEKEEQHQFDLLRLFPIQSQELTYVRMQALRSDMMIMWGEDHAAFGYLDPCPSIRACYYGEQVKFLDLTYTNPAPIEDERVKAELHKIM
tara:strand:+ start:819 stop:1793 length:975 start_codon:yes stop_codon:yes gene_type:complete